eukprot:TRINITY_DN7852_c0_g1_i1.p1 TRINITY_DN7852_c0_g1~~TRINITY_DN7852_c0_g1_i1.p1  ORF type:complete len:299 (-),score=58.86 TRINITY_DN7852_c0_g1_i1:204-1100(-)
MSVPTERNQDATVYVGDLDIQVNESLLWELMLQAGPVVNVHIPRDKLTQAHSGFGFVEFHSEEDADYAIKIMNMIKLYGKPIRVNKASRDKKTLDVGANLFIGNLDPDVDEKLLYDTFSAFGVIIATPKIMRDPDSGGSRGFGFISFDSFEASDAAIEAMNGQFLCNRPISVSYALKKDSKGERHGSQAERLLAANNPIRSRPHTLFATAPPTFVASVTPGGPPVPLTSGSPVAPFPGFPGLPPNFAPGMPFMMPMMGQLPFAPPIPQVHQQPPQPPTPQSIPTPPTPNLPPPPPPPG